MTKFAPSRSLLLAIGLGAGLAAAAAEPRRAEAEAEAPAKPVICREMLKPGSNMVQRVCLTKAEWARVKKRQEHAAQRTVRVLQGSPYEGGSAF